MPCRTQSHAFRGTRSSGRQRSVHSGAELFMRVRLTFITLGLILSGCADDAMGGAVDGTESGSSSGAPSTLSTTNMMTATEGMTTAGTADDSTGTTVDMPD